MPTQLAFASQTQPICGIDEVGRGPLAGPVVTACVYIPEEIKHHAFWARVKDSKKLSPNIRDLLYDEILKHSHSAISIISVEEIDELNILGATLSGMSQSCAKLLVQNIVPPEITALIDGNKLPKNLPCPAQSVVKGDNVYIEIAAASILAKVTRDRIMQNLHRNFPAYEWERNKGYGSEKHLQALHTHGPSPHHRKSFAPVRNMLGVRDS